MGELTKRRVLRQFTVNLQANTLEIQWTTQVLEDGAMLAETFHRKAYAEEQSLELDADLSAEAAIKMRSVMGWV